MSNTTSTIMSTQAARNLALKALAEIEDKQAEFRERYIEHGLSEQRFMRIAFPFMRLFVKEKSREEMGEIVDDMISRGIYNPCYREIEIVNNIIKLCDNSINGEIVISLDTLRSLEV